MTGLTLDLIGGRPPTFVAAYGHWRTGSVKGAIYGGVFMFLLLALAAPLREPAFVAFVKANALLLAPLAGALAYPLIQTIVGSADGTPPFFGRVRQELSRPARLCARDRRRHRRRLGVDLGPQRRQRGGAVPGDVRRRRARLWRRRSRLRRGAHRLGRAARVADMAALRAWAFCSAASSPARSAGISTRRKSMSSSRNSGPMPM